MSGQQPKGPGDGLVCGAILTADLGEVKMFYR